MRTVSLVMSPTRAREGFSAAGLARHHGHGTSLGLQCTTSVSTRARWPRSLGWASLLDAGGTSPHWTIFARVLAVRLDRAFPRSTKPGRPCARALSISAWRRASSRLAPIHLGTTSTRPCRKRLSTVRHARAGDLDAARNRWICLPQARAAPGMRVSHGCAGGALKFAAERYGVVASASPSRASRASMRARVRRFAGRFRRRIPARTNVFDRSSRSLSKHAAPAISRGHRCHPRCWPITSCSCAHIGGVPQRGNTDPLTAANLPNSMLPSRSRSRPRRSACHRGLA